MALTKLPWSAPPTTPGQEKLRPTRLNICGFRATTQYQWPPQGKWVSGMVRRVSLSLVCKGADLHLYYEYEISQSTQFVYQYCLLKYKSTHFALVV